MSDIVQDNLNPQTDNLNPEPQPVEPQQPVQPEQPSGFNWKLELTEDLRNSPTLQKFGDDREGLVKAVESHLNLEKLLGHEKVPIPKDPNDTAAIKAFNKAMGVPDEPTGYKLDEVQFPSDLEGVGFDKGKFSDIVHKLGLSQKQAEGLWKDYTSTMVDQYQNAVRDYEGKMNEVSAKLREEWGDAYEANAKLADQVIEVFSQDKETSDYLANLLTKDPRAVKFLAKIGDQFSEHKIGQFQARAFSLTPAEAQRKLDEIRGDLTHPYWNEKEPQELRDEAMRQVLELEGVLHRAKRTT